MPRPIQADIDRLALTHNLARVSSVVRAHDPTAQFWAVVKANAYGHGIEVACESFAAADGLALLDLSEANRARSAGWSKPILLLEGPFSVSDVHVAQQLGLTLVIHQLGQIEMLRAGLIGRPIAVYLKLDTGMNRLGLQADQYQRGFEQLSLLQQVGIVSAISHMTHFACADSFDGIDEQTSRFVEVVQGLPGDWCLSNSAASLRHAPAIAALGKRFERRLWYRPGICLYGCSPFDDATAADLALRPAMTLTCELISVRSVSSGDGIGYGHAFRATSPMKIGVVACGYADGYPRHAPTGTPVAVGDQMTRVLGRVSMDMVMVDLTGIDSAHVGQRVVMWGQGGPSADLVAQSAATISYELLSGLTNRVPRVIC